MSELGFPLIIFFLGISTIILSLMSLRIIYMSKYLHNPFGAICVLQSITETFAGISFGLWAAPMAFFFPELSKSFIGSLFGCIVAFCYYHTMYLHLLKSINRTYAAVFPIHYHTKFSIKSGNIILGATIVISLLAISQFFEYSCNYGFDPTIFMWRQREPTCSQTRSISLISLLSTVCGCVFCDIITFCCMIIFKKKLHHSSNNKAAHERRFFLQTCLSTIVYVLLTLSFKVFAPEFATNQTLLICFVTIAWQLFHLLNQLIFVVFSIRKKITTAMVTPNSLFTPPKPMANIS